MYFIRTFKYFEYLIFAKSGCFILFGIWPDLDARYSIHKDFWVVLGKIKIIIVYKLVCTEKKSDNV